MDYWTIEKKYIDRSDKKDMNAKSHNEDIFSP